MRISAPGLWTLLVLLLCPAGLRAQTAPTLSQFSPSDRVFFVGSSDSLIVRPFSGTQPFTYQWFKAGVAIPGATGADLLFPFVTEADAGKYSVRVSNAVGSVTSREVTVTVFAAQPVVFTLQPSSVTVVAGQSAQFEVNISVSTTLPVTYQWRRNGTPIIGATANPLVLAATTLADAGDYTVVATNAAGSVTSASGTLTVTSATPPAITTQPQRTSGTEGQSVSLSVAATGSAPLAYQWYRNGSRLAVGANVSTYSFTARLGDAGDYYVVVSNGGGSVTSSIATLTVAAMPAPPVAAVPDQLAEVGGELALAATASRGLSPLSSWNATFQWYRNGQPLTGATQIGFRKAPAQLQDAGDYFLVTTNAAGTTTSRTGRLDVIPRVAPQLGAWLVAERSGDLVYFLFTAPARIERFNLATEAWLPAIPLGRTPTAFAVGGDALFIASGSSIYRRALDGSGETLLVGGFASEVAGLAVTADFLFAQYGGYGSASLAVIRLADGVRVSSMNYGYDWGSAIVAAPRLRRVFSLEPHGSTSAISFTTYDVAGGIPRLAISNRIGNDSPVSTRVYVSPGETIIADNGGRAYRADDLSYFGALGGPFDDLVFTSTGLPVVLRSGKVVTFDESFRVTGQVSTDIAAARIFLSGGQAYAFGVPTAAGGAVPWTKVALAQAVPPAVASAVDPEATPFIPDAVFADRDGTVYLYSKLLRHIFRWSPTERRYLTPIQLQGWPDCVTYSATNHRIYLAYTESRILQVKLDAGSLREESFATAPQGVLGLAAAGDLLFLATASRGWEAAFYALGADGALKSPRVNGRFELDYAWSASLRRMFYFSTSSDLRYSEVSTTGVVGAERGATTSTRIEARGPIRVSPDGGSVLVGEGRIFNASTIAPVAALANGVDDGVWSGGRLFTGRRAAGGTELQRWDGAGYALGRSRTIPGRLMQLVVLSGARLLAVTVRDGAPLFTLLDEELNAVRSTPAAPGTRLVNLATRAQAGQGDQLLIPGFVIAGAQPKRVLIRAAGPALAAFGVTGALADPQLTVFNQAGTAVASNNDWDTASPSGDVISVATKVGAFPFAVGSRDAAVLVSLAPGGYTVQARGAGDTTGVALVEIYDAQDADSAGRIVNIASRAQVGTGADVLIPGIVVQGTAPRTLLIRAVGPGLTTFGVGGVLANPQLRLFRGDQIVAENDDWGRGAGATAAEISAATTRAGAFSLANGSRDAVLLITLAPGAYTAQVSGVDGGSGVALVEVYEVGN